MPPAIFPSEVKAKLQQGDDFFLLDVREVHEHRARNIPQAALIPLREVPRRINEIPRSKPIVVHCKAGVRSARVCDFLRQNGYSDVLNMAGGIDAW
jgi:adenylyltransferase/sulfurtransferase